MMTRRHIYLIGFSGSGKSTVGPLLARKLECGFADSDSVIEKAAGESIDAIFADVGEKGFRRMEMAAVASLSLRNARQVIALGGGALLTRPTRTVVRSTGTTVYLRCSMPVICSRLARHSNRPLLHKSGESLRRRVARLLAQRRSLYETAAEITVSTTRKRPHEVVSEIIRRLGRQ